MGVELPRRGVILRRNCGLILLLVDDTSDRLYSFLEAKHLLSPAIDSCRQSTPDHPLKIQ